VTNYLAETTLLAFYLRQKEPNIKPPLPREKEFGMNGTSSHESETLELLSRSEH
jgi:hypothetical protein